jgi:hypothetical protein
VIPLFISVAQAAAKEKIVRVNIATLRVSAFVLPRHIFIPSRTHTLSTLEPCHESTICQSAGDVGRPTPPIREEPRDSQVVG